MNVKLTRRLVALVPLVVLLLAAGVTAQGKITTPKLSSGSTPATTTCWRTTPS